MSNYHFYFGGGFQVFKLLLGPHRQQIKEPGTMNTEELQIARSSDMSHLILQIEIVLQLNFSADKKRNLGDQSIRVVAVVAKGSEKQAQNPDLCHRKIASNQRCMHLPGNSHHVPVHLLRGVWVCIHTINTHQHNPAISGMTERLTRGSGGSHPRARMHVPQLQQPLCLPMLQCL